MEKYKASIIILMLLISSLGLIIGFSDVSNGSTITVGDDGDYKKISSAISAANSGDTIRIYSGTYYENLKIEKSVNLIGNGSEETINHGGGKERTLWIKAKNVSISKLGITSNTRNY